VDTNLKMAAITKEGYGAIPDYKEIADQNRKVATLQDEMFPIGIRVELQELKVTLVIIPRCIL